MNPIMSRCFVKLKNPASYREQHYPRGTVLNIPEVLARCWVGWGDAEILRGDEARAASEAMTARALAEKHKAFPNEGTMDRGVEFRARGTDGRLLEPSSGPTNR